MTDNLRIESARPDESKANSGAKVPLAEHENGLSDVGHRVVDAVQDKVHDLRDLASDKYEASKEKLVELEAKVAATVQAAPVKSVIIAAGVGALLGVLWSRR